MSKLQSKQAETIVSVWDGSRP